MRGATGGLPCLTGSERFYITLESDLVYFFGPVIETSYFSMPPYSCSLCDPIPAGDRNWHCHTCWLRGVLLTKLLLQYDIPFDVFPRHAPHDLLGRSLPHVTCEVRVHETLVK